MRDQDRVIELRGHHLLCLQGFEGDGYSPDFVANLSNLLDRLTRSPESVIRLVDSGDDICHCCPHWTAMACQRYDNAILTRQDSEVLVRLGLQAGQSRGWDRILHRIGRNVDPVRLSDICGDCPWLSQGTCEKGLTKLKVSAVRG